MYFDIIISGFGGQGVMFMGNLLAYAAMTDGHKCTYMPVYGVEMRGGTANCTVVISDDDIGSPVIQHPLGAIVMNKPSVLKFGSRVKKNGILLVNSSLVEARDVKVKGPEILMVPALDLAKEAGNPGLANMAMLGVLAEKTGVVSMESVITSMEKSLPERAHKMIPINTKALQKGAEFVKNGVQ